MPRPAESKIFRRAATEAGQQAEKPMNAEQEYVLAPVVPSEQGVD
jgi:hypothetical protein